MIDHTGIFVSDYEKAKAFYDAVFAPLGARLLMTVPPEYTGGKKVSGYGVKKPDFWLTEATETGPGRHYAFTARSRAEVDAFYQAAIAPQAGGIMARPASASIIIRRIMAPSSSIPTATISRRCVMRLNRKGG